MAVVFSIRDGETLSHKELMVQMGFKTDRSMKDWINDHDIPYFPTYGKWWVASEDVRAALRNASRTHKQWQAFRNNEDPMDEPTPSKKPS